MQKMQTAMGEEAKETVITVTATIKYRKGSNRRCQDGQKGSMQ